MAEKKEVGKVTHFFSSINVGAIKLSGILKVGDTVSIEGTTTNFQQKIDSMQINKEKVVEAKAGQEIGMKLNERAREGDIVYKVA